jgi:hypothetical protein
MNDYEKLVPAECKAIFEHAIEQSREHMRKFGRVAMVAFVGSVNDDECSIGIVALESLPNKAKAAQALGMVVREKDADFVLFVCEMYLLETKAKNMEEARALEREAERVGVKNMAGRIDGIMFQLETGIGHFMGTSEVTTTGDVRSFETPKMQLIPNYKGTFANLLPKKKQ